MQASLTTIHGLERRLEVAVPGEQVAGEVDQRLKRLARTARLKGFRPGKIPFDVVRAQFGSQVHAQTVTELMQSSFAEAVSQHRLRPAGGPRIEPIAVAPGSELRYAAIFEVLPDVALKPLAAITVDRPSASVSDPDLDRMLESMRSQRPVFTAVERPAQEGDRVAIDFEGRIDGEVFPGGKGEGMQVTLGAHRILSEIEQALVGMRAGDSKQVPAQFPEDYGAKAVAGKQAQFDIKVMRVEDHSLPPLDEEFAKAFGVQEGGLSRLRSEVRTSMERELAEATRSRVRDQLFNALYRDNPLDLPRSMIDEQIRELQGQAARRTGTQDPKLLPTAETLEPNARKRVALGLLLTEIVRAQNLKVDRTRVEERLEQLVAGRPDPQEARRQYLASREAMEQIESAALEDQALDWALTQVKVQDQPMTFAELTGFGQNA
ncbi:MAG TPA: trigger factor [Steroidobacteraceae bacterium]|jgi:trigger factor